MLTEIVTLPSKGKLYPEDSPLAKGEVEIRYMTTKDEDILTTQTYLEKGIILDKLLESVIVTKGVKVDDLTVGDKQALLLQTRILGYGSKYDVKVNGKLHTVDLSELGEKGRPDLFENTPFIDYTLTKSEKRVKLKILNSKESREIQEEINILTEKGIPYGDVTLRLSKIIVNVDGETDESKIRNFINDDLLAIDSLGVREFLELVTPDIDFTIELGGEEVEIPIGINFFYPSYKA